MGVIGEPMARWQRQIRVAAQLRPADAPAQLIELGEPEAVRAMDNHGVDPLQVEPRFDDRGGDQHVVLAVVEVAHDGIERARGEAAVGDGDLHLGHQAAHALGHLVEVGDARAYVEGLPAAQVLAHQRLAHDHGVEGQDEGAHREAVHRRSRDHAHVAHAAQGHLERAGDRRGGERQHVGLGLELLKALLVGDAEVLLLVHDDETEIVEDDLLAPAARGCR